MTDWKPFTEGWKSKNDVTLYDKCVSCIFGCGLKITECTQLFWFHGGGDEKVLEMYGCCNVVHAKRTLHIKYPNNTSNALLYGLPKRKQIIIYLLSFIQFKN